MNKKIVTLKAFEEVASKNGYEVFTPEEVASYYKEGLMKSMGCQMGLTEKEEFALDIIGLQKAVVSGDNCKETVRYYRKKQVEWETSQDGTILKGIEGIYLDTPENRRLKRVGQPYIANEEIVKSICEADENIMKAVRTGRYADTSENRRLHRVGQPYKTRGKKSEESENKGDKKDVSTGLSLGSVKEAVQKEFGGRFENGKYSGGTSISFKEKGGEITVTVMDKGKSVKDKLENIAKKLGAEGIHDKEESGFFSTVYKFKKNSEGVSKKEDPKPEQKTEEKKDTKSEKKDTSKTDDTQEEKYTRVKFDDLPDSGKVNLKKYLTTKRKSAVDNKLSDISKMDTSELKKIEKEAVSKFNKDFGESKKSQRAEDLYYIMKIKGELSKRK